MRRICILSLLIIQLLILISLAAVQPALPSGINYYIPINIINAQTSAFPSNGQLMVEINSSAYKSYESNNLQNIEFFYQNGTIIPSWLEGDLVNHLGLKPEASYEAPRVDCRPVLGTYFGYSCLSM